MLKKILILSIFCTLFLTACGQTGALYLPQQNPNTQNAQAHIS